MARRRATDPTLPIAERIAWWALLAVPALVPVVIGIVPFSSQGPWTHNPFIYPRILTLAVLVGVAACAWSVAVLRGALRVRSVPFGWWLAGFMALAGVSTAFAMSPSMAFFGGQYQSVGMLSLVLAGAVFFLSTQLLTSLGRMRALSWSAVAGGTTVAVVTILQVRDLDPLGLSRENLYVLQRGPSLLGNPDFTATYLVVPLLVAAGLALSASSVKSKAVGWFLSALMLLAVATSLTRGAWFGVAIGTVALAMSARRSSPRIREGRWILGGLGLVVAASLLYRGPASFLARFSDLASTATAGDGRFVLWRDALAVAAEHPLLGTGPDSYRLGWYAARSLESVRLSGVALTTEDPHNIVLLLMATMGIPAALYAVGLVVATLWGTRKAAFARDIKPERLLYSGWWSALLALAVALFFGVNTVTAAVMLFVAAAVLLAPRTAESSLTRTGSTLLAGGVAAVSILLLVVSALTLVADMRLGSALAASEPEGVANAARIAPWHAQAQYEAARLAANDALSAFTSADPQAVARGALAEIRIRDLTIANPYEYDGQLLLAYYAGQSGALQAPSDPAAAVLAFQNSGMAAARALQLKPTAVDAALLKALAESSLGDNAAAIATLEPVWDIDPRFAEAGILYLRLLEQEGEKERAAQVLAALRTGFLPSAVIDDALRSREASAATP